MNIHRQEFSRVCDARLVRQHAAVCPACLSPATGFVLKKSQTCTYDLHVFPPGLPTGRAREDFSGFFQSIQLLFDDESCHVCAVAWR
jgi:hypothetical protein